MKNTVLIITASLLLGACAGGSSRYAMEHDRAPDGDFNAERIPNAVPRVEPRSRYGNPDSYVVNGKRYYVKASSRGYAERGRASWYGKKFHGHRTSSGETYDMYAMTAAHKTLPLPTYVEVTNLDNNRKIIVKVNDRGPFHPGRIIDLSYAAAKKLGMTGHGTAPVEVRALDPRQPAAPLQANEATHGSRYIAARMTRPGASTASLKEADNSSRYIAARMGRLPDKAGEPSQAASPSPSATTDIFVQVGAFSSQDNAEQLREQLNRRFTKLNVAATFHDDTRLYRVRIGPLDSREQADQLIRQINSSGLGTPRLVLD